MEQISSTNQNQKEGYNIMTTENTTPETVTVSNDTVATPKRPMVERSMDRINFHLNKSAELTARLEKLEAEGKTEQKAYVRCQAAIAKNEAFLADLRAKLAARLEKAASKTSESETEQHVEVLVDVA